MARKAELMGAKRVMGPGPSKTSSKSAIYIASTNSVNSFCMATCNNVCSEERRVGDVGAVIGSALGAVVDRAAVVTRGGLVLEVVTVIPSVGAIVVAMITGITVGMVVAIELGAPVVPSVGASVAVLPEGVIVAPALGAVVIWMLEVLGDAVGEVALIIVVEGTLVDNSEAIVEDDAVGASV